MHTHLYGVCEGYTKVDVCCVREIFELVSSPGFGRIRVRRSDAGDFVAVIVMPGISDFNHGRTFNTSNCEKRDRRTRGASNNVESLTCTAALTETNFGFFIRLMPTSAAARY